MKCSDGENSTDRLILCSSTCITKHYSCAWSLKNRKRRKQKRGVNVKLRMTYPTALRHHYENQSIRQTFRWTLLNVLCMLRVTCSASQCEDNVTSVKQNLGISVKMVQNISSRNENNISPKKTMWSSCLPFLLSFQEFSVSADFHV